MEDDNIVVLDIIRIERNRPRKCTCQGHRNYTVDPVNREIICACGLVVDPFEAMLDLANRYEEIGRKHQALFEQQKEWISQKPHSVLFKRLEQSYRRGTMLPFCPHCNKMFDFNEVVSFGNAEIYKKLKGRDKR